jgi:hypothetical protein
MDMLGGFTLDEWRGILDHLSDEKREEILQMIVEESKEPQAEAVFLVLPEHGELLE